MTRLLSITALSLALLGGPALAQTAAAKSDTAQEVKREQRSANRCADAKRTHALNELCNWIGQYR
jgi:hypothetical protein